MKHALIIILFFSVLSNCFAQQDEGQSDDMTITACVGCHNRNVESNYIVIGERKGYIAKALQSYRDQLWTSPVMRTIAADMSDEDIHQVSAVLSKMDRCQNFERSGHEDAVVDVSSAKLQLCEACHSEGSQSNPSLNGQSKAFMIEALTHFKSKKWFSPSMNPVAAQLSDRDIEVLASYYSSQCD